ISTLELESPTRWKSINLLFPLDERYEREFTTEVELLYGSGSRGPTFKKVRKDKRESNSRGHLEDPPHKLKERPSANWLSISRQPSSSFSPGSWRQATCNLRDEGGQATLSGCAQMISTSSIQFASTLHLHPISESSIPACSHVATSSPFTTILQRTLPHLAVQTHRLRHVSQCILRSVVGIPSTPGSFSSVRLRARTFGLILILLATPFHKTSATVSGGSFKSQYSRGACSRARIFLAPGLRMNPTQRIVGKGLISGEGCLRSGLVDRAYHGNRSSDGRCNMGGLGRRAEYRFPSALLEVRGLRAKAGLFTSVPTISHMGTSPIDLGPFRRGEAVKAWWPGFSMAAGEQHGEILMEIKFDEEIVLPLELYSEMKDILIRRNYFEMCESSTNGAGGANTAAGVIEGADLMAYWLQQMWDSIWKARDGCPNELRHLFYNIRTQVEARWGSSALHADLKYQAISAFLFLRFFIPALLRPEQHGLVVGPPPEGVERSLKSLARALQSLANLNTNVQREEFMRSVKAFNEDNVDAMIDYLTLVSTPSDRRPVVHSVPPTLSSGHSHTPQAHMGLSRDLSPELQIRTALQARLPSMAALHRESLPVLPYMTDEARDFAVIASAVVRNARTPQGLVRPLHREIGPMNEVFEGLIEGSLGVSNADVGDEQSSEAAEATADQTGR
ncbi:hypothetical protein RSAG8_01645, partial [Rhizoctonia solani AG-8 WAC10335]